MIDLLQATYDTLDGAITHDGAPVEVYLRGHVGDAVPCVVIERPPIDGTEYLDRSVTGTARLRIRIHDRQGHAGYSLKRAYEIAGQVRSLLSSGVDVGGSAVAFTEPNQRPLSYEAEGQQATDLVLVYDLFLPAL
jgi:hypothetical protein